MEIPLFALIKLIAQHLLRSHLDCFPASQNVKEPEPSTAFLTRATLQLTDVLDATLQWHVMITNPANPAQEIIAKSEAASGKI